jgi:hypothetical protein
VNHTNLSKLSILRSKIMGTKNNSKNLEKISKSQIQQVNLKNVNAKKICVRLQVQGGNNVDA